MEQTARRERLRNGRPSRICLSVGSGTSVIDAAVLVVRRIVSYMHEALWDEHLGKNSLIKYATMDFPNDTEASAEAEEVQMIKLENDLLVAHYSDWSFYKIIESKDMRLNFWARTQMQFTTGQIVTLVICRPVQPQGAISTEELRVRARELGLSEPVILAADSFLKWDGSKSLNDAARDYLRVTINRHDQPTFPWPNFPLCVRVLYTPGYWRCPGFRDIMMDPLRLQGLFMRKTQDDGT